MPTRKKSRTFHIPITSRADGKTYQPGEEVSLEHLTDAEYDKINRLYPETMTAAEAKAKAEQEALNNPNRLELQG